jgi:uncharacterized membrane protein YfcA
VAQIPAVPLGYLIDLQLLKRISQSAFARAAMILLMLAGIKLLWDAFAEGVYRTRYHHGFCKETPP